MKQPHNRCWIKYWHSLMLTLGRYFTINQQSYWHRLCKTGKQGEPGENFLQDWIKHRPVLWHNGLWIHIRKHSIQGMKKITNRKLSCAAAMDRNSVKWTHDPYSVWNFFIYCVWAGQRSFYYWIRIELPINFQSHNSIHEENKQGFLKIQQALRGLE